MEPCAQRWGEVGRKKTPKNRRKGIFPTSHHQGFTDTIWTRSLRGTKPPWRCAKRTFQVKTEQFCLQHLSGLKCADLQPLQNAFRRWGGKIYNICMCFSNTKLRNIQHHMHLKPRVMWTHKRSTWKLHQQLRGNLHVNILAQQAVLRASFPWLQRAWSLWGCCSSCWPILAESRRETWLDLAVGVRRRSGAQRFLHFGLFFKVEWRLKRFPLVSRCSQKEEGMN